jgi:hypothetical protein
MELNVKKLFPFSEFGFQAGVFIYTTSRQGLGGGGISLDLP